RVAALLHEHVLGPIGRRIDDLGMKLFSRVPEPAPAGGQGSGLGGPLTVVLGAGVAYGLFRAVGIAMSVRIFEWRAIVIGLVATLIRVFVSLAIAVVWTVPVGVAIGSRPRVASWLQPIVEIAASVPATALFPALVLMLLR